MAQFLKKKTFCWIGKFMDRQIVKLFQTNWNIKNKSDQCFFLKVAI